MATHEIDSVPPVDNGGEDANEYRDLGKRSKLKLRLVMDVFTKVALKEVEAQGMEQVDAVDRSKPLVIVVTHMSGGPDLDLPVAADVMSHEFPIVIANQSTHHDGSEPAMLRSMKIAGAANFVPVSYHFRTDEDGGPSGKQPDMFNPEDTDAMVEAMRAGKVVIVAANNPYPDENTDEATKVDAARPGHLAAYLASLTGAQVLPVGVHVSEEGAGQFRGRQAKLVVGGPFTFEPGPEDDQTDFSEIGRIMRLRQSGDLNEGDGRRLIELTRALRERSQRVFDAADALRVEAGGIPRQPKSLRANSESARQAEAAEAARQQIKDA